MTASDKNREIKSINEKVLAFGISSVLLVIVLICAVLIFFLYQAHTSLLDEREKTAEQVATIYDLRRALDRVGGRLSVYEEFLIGTQMTATRSLIKKYLKEKRIEPDGATLSQFEDWMREEQHAYEAVGGHR